ncbi:hypothetical protein BD311DRAFT_766093, partial [Dichomitus squalens]
NICCARHLNLLFESNLSGNFVVTLKSRPFHYRVEPILSRMHRCLKINDTFRLTFNEHEDLTYDLVIPDLLRSRSLSTIRALAALAQTCRAFNEPALDILWRHIPDSFSLISRILPKRSHFIVRGEYEENATLYLTGDLHAVDWIKPDPYVTRIQSVGVIIPELRTGIRPLLHPEYVLKPVLDYPIHHANAPDTLFPNRVRSVIFKDSRWAHESSASAVQEPPATYPERGGQNG